MKTRINRFLVITGVICLLLSACGGGGGGGLSDGPFGDLSENPPSSQLVGDWELTAEITSLDSDDCEEMGGSVGDTQTYNITISEEECTTNDDDPENGTVGECQAADNDVVVVYVADYDMADYDLDGCTYTETDEIHFSLDENGNSDGSFTANVTFSGECTYEDSEGNEADYSGSCDFSGTVTGTQSSATSTDENDGTDTGGDDSTDDGSDDDTSDDDAGDDSEGDDAGDDSTSTDTDGDGTADESDNCPDDSNADQADTDADGTGDACDKDTDNDGLCDVADLCNNNDIDPDLGYVNDWYWVDSADGDPTLHLQSGYSVLNVPRTFADGTYDGSEIVVYGVVDGFKDQTGNIYTFCTGFNGSLVGVCIEK